MVFSTTTPVGQINIDRSSTVGIINDTGHFTNQGAITMGSMAGVGNYGLENYDTFNNNTGTNQY